MTTGAEPILSVRDLRVSFGDSGMPIDVVRDVSFDVAAGETVALVGESGCGKSMTALALMGLIPEPGRVLGGRLRIDGRELSLASKTDMRSVRGRDIAMVFQDPATYLNPVMRVGDQVIEAARQHGSGKDAEKAALDALDVVGLPDPRALSRRYPHELSGGMRQRVLIAMALTCRPKVLIADEPTTALDVTIQAQILALLQDLQKQLGMSIIFITHDLGVVSGLCDRVCVMYSGRVVERCTIDSFLTRPEHPYSAGLLRSVMSIESDAGDLYAIEGRVPDPSAPPPGCAFNPRCAHAQDVCRSESPELRPTSAIADNLSACFFPESSRMDSESNQMGGAVK
jgi:oligopeptide/dipeptide ABC transporter ATP-binding protein